MCLNFHVPIYLEGIDLAGCAHVIPEKSSFAIDEVDRLRRRRQIQALLAKPASIHQAGIASCGCGGIDDLARARVDAIAGNEQIAGGARAVLEGCDHAVLVRHLNADEILAPLDIDPPALGFIRDDHAQGDARIKLKRLYPVQQSDPQFPGQT